MRSTLVETLVGAVVIGAAVLFLIYASSAVDTRQSGGYDLVARFERIDGVGVGTDVRISGIKVGSVAEVDLDPRNYYAVTHLSLRDEVKVPDDSSVKITSEGLLGGAYLSIEPGGSETMLASGGEIQNTQGAIDLVGLLGKVMFSGGGESDAETTPPPPPAP